MIVSPSSTRKHQKPNGQARPKGDPLRFLQRRRRWRRGVAIGFVVLLMLGWWLDRSGFLLHQGDLFRQLDGQVFEVVHVVDGDTLDIDRADRNPTTGQRYPRTRVRLWGLDTPEIAKAAREDRAAVEAEPFGEAAHALTRELVEGQRVVLRLEPHRMRGRHGRVLAYVELEDGRMLNELLLDAGLARAEKRWAHQHLETFAMLELNARKLKKGMWGQ